MDSFDYMVVDETRRILVYRSYELEQALSIHSYSEFDQYVQSDAILSRSYKERIITSCAAYFTLVPKKLFQAGSEKAYLQQVSELSDRYLIRHDPESSGQMVNVFALHQFIDQWAKDRFPGATQTHAISQLVKLGERHLVSAKNRLYMFLSGHRLILVLWIDGQLQYSNIFTVYEPSQLIYYLGLLFNQFKIKQSETAVYYLGGLHPDHHFYKVLTQYLNQPVLIGPPPPIQLSNELSKVPANLLTLPAVATL